MLQNAGLVIGSERMTARSEAAWEQRTQRVRGNNLDGLQEVADAYKEGWFYGEKDSERARHRSKAASKGRNISRDKLECNNR